jgi:hypothetical protein
VNNKDFENLAREKSKNYKINKPPANILANNKKKSKSTNKNKQQQQE